jgi:ribosomal protein S18 acetylase RimI-like enzyme
VKPELRAPTLADLPELVAFFEDLRDRYGEHAMTEAQLRDNLTSKRWKPEENYRVALVDGNIAGWSSLWSPGDQPERIFLNLRVAGRELPVYSPLLDWAEQRAAEIASGEPARVNAGAVHDDEVLLAELRRRGYEFARHFFEMKIDLSDEPATPVWPDGFTVRTFTPDDARAVFEADKEAFEDHWDSFTVSFEEWSHYFLRSSEFEPELWFLVEDGDQLAAYALCSNEGGEAEGVVNVLGVRRPWRRRGLGTALLLHAFHEFRRHGRDNVGLQVDAENLTGAVGLYERAGMHVARRFERFTKELT